MEEEVDYSEDPHPEKVIFGCPNFSSTEVGPSHPSNPSPPIPSPVVTLPDHRSDHHSTINSPRSSTALDLPPMSPGILHFLSTVIPPSPSFDLHPQNTTFFAATSSGSPLSVAATHSASLYLPSGYFETPAVRVRPEKPIHLEGSPDPLVDHQSTPLSGKKRTKCVKATSKDISICFGDTSAIEEAAIMVSTILVGHVRGRVYSVTRLTQWVKEIWGGVLKELPEVQALPRGWFALHFAKENYTDLVLARYWHIEMAPVLLKRWSPLFDPEREQIGAGLLWVRLPGLPLQYWSEEVFMRIGNALGSYLDHERTFVESRNRTLACILVYLDTHEGLEEKITLHWGKFTRVQILDYEGVPFRCCRCHKVGHIFKDCPLNKKLEDIPTPSNVPSRTISPANLRTSAPGPPITNPQISSSIARRTLSPPISRSQVAVEAAIASGTSLSPPLSCFSPCFSLHIPSMFVAYCTLPTSPVNTPSSLSLHSLPSHSSSPCSSRGTKHPYNLHPRIHSHGSQLKIVGLGLVTTESTPLMVWGRISFMSKAIRCAEAEVASGRQSTINGVLRAADTPGNLPP